MERMKARSMRSLRRHNSHPLTLNPRQSNTAYETKITNNKICNRDTKSTNVATAFTQTTKTTTINKNTTLQQTKQQTTNKQTNKQTTKSEHIIIQSCVPWPATTESRAVPRQHTVSARRPMYVCLCVHTPLLKDSQPESEPSAPQTHRLSLPTAHQPANNSRQ